MSFSTLPRYSDYRQKGAAPGSSPGRGVGGKRLFHAILQIAFLVVVWGIVFNLRKVAQAAAQPPKPALVGKWSSTGRKHIILEFRYGTIYTLSRDGKTFLQGGYLQYPSYDRDKSLYLIMRSKDGKNMDSKAWIEYEANAWWLVLDGHSLISKIIYANDPVPEWVKLRRVD